ncbi:hypothetical protein AB0B88_15945 [Micromonospora haikouensis]|uniref:hypothetical protein n=1 Tax=Micromonospora haikouensis TaxID=686309 RepID=UPI0033DE3158
MTTLAPPPPGFLIRSTRPPRVAGAPAVEMLWHPTPAGRWVATTAHGYHCDAAWPELAAGEWGPLELLVPVPYNADSPHPGTDAARLALVEGVLEPVAQMARQLLDAAGAGLLAVVADIANQVHETDDAEAATVVPLRSVPLRPATPARPVEHGVDGPPTWSTQHPAYVAHCLCGDLFQHPTNPDKAAEYRAEHLATIDPRRRW